MTDNTVIWQTIQDHAPKQKWLSIAEVYAIVEQYAAFDPEDLETGRSPYHLPRWKANVRRVLKDKKNKGEVVARRK